MDKGKASLKITERTVTLKMTVNKAAKAGAEKLVQKKLGVSVFPIEVPLSTVRVKTHGTFNMGDYNSVQASVEIEDSTISHPQARSALVDVLTAEVLDFNAKLAHRAAARLFNRELRKEDLDA